MEREASYQYLPVATDLDKKLALGTDEREEYNATPAPFKVKCS